MKLLALGFIAIFMIVVSFFPSKKITYCFVVDQYRKDDLIVFGSSRLIKTSRATRELDTDEFKKILSDMGVKNRKQILEGKCLGVISEPNQLVIETVRNLGGF